MKMDVARPYKTLTAIRDDTNVVMLSRASLSYRTRKIPHKVLHLIDIHCVFDEMWVISIDDILFVNVVLKVMWKGGHYGYGNPVDGPYCQGCALLRKKIKEDLFTYCVENGIFQDLQDTFESSNDNTNVVNAPQEPFVVKQDPGENSLQSPSYIDHNCCYECGDSLDDIFCQ
ncbi:hypothetical protein Tco_0226968 [Tanacetum coccineum]